MLLLNNVLTKNGQEELPGPPTTQDREDGVFSQTR